MKNRHIHTEEELQELYEISKKLDIFIWKLLKNDKIEFESLKSLNDAARNLVVWHNEQRENLWNLTNELQKEEFLTNLIYRLIEEQEKKH